MNAKKISVVLSIFLVTSCANFGSSVPSTEPTNKNKAAAPTPTPEKPKKKPEEVWKCKISNGAGRIFNATDESRDTSEAKARHQCGIFSRTCILLDCSLTTAEEDE